MNQPIHIAITRRVKPGRETEFEQALREFIRDSFTQGGILGAGLIMPLPGSDRREYGILRTFASENERDLFYNSELFNTWNARCKPLTEGEPEYRQLTGLEAWFRNPAANPPIWKMALLTYLGVDVVTSVLLQTLGPAIQGWPFLLRNSAFNVVVVALLTWPVMPVLAKLAGSWLNPKSNQNYKL